MKIIWRVYPFLSVFFLCSSLSFGSAIVSGFNNTSDGRNDDGTYTLGGCTNPFDGGTCVGTAVPIGFTINFFGQTFDSLYINTNGNITFDAPLPYVQGLLQASLLGSFNYVVAPFLADVDTRNSASGVVTFGSGQFDGYQAFGVNWPNVGYFDQEADKLNSFQLLLVDRPDEGPGAFEIIFNYGGIQWETGDADFGTDGLGGYSAIAGFTDGSGNPANTFELPGSGVPGSFIDGGPNALVSNSLNSDVPGRYIFNFGNSEPVTPIPEPATISSFLVVFVLLLFQRTIRYRSGSPALLPPIIC